MSASGSCEDAASGCAEHRYTEGKLQSCSRSAARHEVLQSVSKFRPCVQFIPINHVWIAIGPFLWLGKLVDRHKDLGILAKINRHGRRIEWNSQLYALDAFFSRHLSGVLKCARP